MAVVKRGKHYSIAFDINGKQAWIKTPARSKEQARLIEAAIKTAIRSGDYGGLNSTSKEVCLQLFRNKGWKVPQALEPEAVIEEELTLWKGIQILAEYPGVKGKSVANRHRYSTKHLIRLLGANTPIKDIWVPQLKKYQAARLSEGAAPSTINWEIATLSKMFTVLEEYRLVDYNPARRTKSLPTRSGERQVYLSHDTVNQIVSKCPDWFKTVVWLGYYTGMRRGEIMNLRRSQVDLAKRMIRLEPTDTKEGHWKRVPLRLEVVEMLRIVMEVPTLHTDRVILIQDHLGVRPAELEAYKNCWPRACKALGWEKPWPRLHDLRHTWKTNARRSGMHPEIEQAIMGHSNRARSVHERYGYISDEELIQAIDSMTFEHGDTHLGLSKNPRVLAKS